MFSLIVKLIYPILSLLPKYDLFEFQFGKKTFTALCYKLTQWFNFFNQRKCVFNEKILAIGTHNVTLCRTTDYRISFCLEQLVNSNSYE